MTPIQYRLDRGYALTVTPAADERAVSVVCAEDAAESALIRASRTWGPYLVPRNFTVQGDASSSVDVPALSSLGGLLMVSDGAPVDAVKATKDINPAGNDNGLTFTARQYGTGGNDITVAYVNPSANNATLSVSVTNRTAISVSLATGAGGAITSTAASILAAVEAHSEANEIVSVALLTTDAGYVSGAGVVTAISATALAGGSGTGIGTAQPGALCIDTTNGAVYRNGGTRAAPDWHANGQFLSTTVPTASAVAHTTDTPVNICSLTLPAGEWDVSAVINRSLTGVTATRYTGAIATESATIPNQAGGDGLGTDPVITQFATFGTTVTGAWSTAIPPVRFVATESATLYLVVRDLFSAGTMTVFGTLRARRIV